MVIDSSALLAIVFGEADAPSFIDAIGRAFESSTAIYIPAPVLVEAGVVADQRARGEQLDALIDRMEAEIAPLNERVARIARKAFEEFGRGRHQARLNFGDCMSYATARYLQLPLLYKGDDFKKTDIDSALATLD